MTRRAFSLVEALAATALMALIAAACMPLLRAPRGAPAAPPGDDLVVLVEALADRAAHAPGAFSVDLDSASTTALAWPEDLRREADALGVALPAASASVELPEDDGAVRDRWIVVRCGDATALRWALAPERKSERSKRLGGRKGSAQLRKRRPGRRRRGMTLVETVVAVAITALLATAVAAWTVGAARFAASSSSRESADSALDAIGRLLDDDLASIDADARAARRPGDDRVRVEDGELVVRTRSSLPDRAGPVTRRYEFDPAARSLVVRDALPDGSSRTATVARDVARWEAAIGSSEESRVRRGAAPRRLAVTVAVGGSPAVTFRRTIR
ncbi:MAG: prepilin-type N-terminal cleavage/methylation domain-containing protein [Phycisphaerales bacterium]